MLPVIFYERWNEYAIVKDRFRMWKQLDQKQTRPQLLREGGDSELLGVAEKTPQLSGRIGPNIPSASPSRPWRLQVSICICMVHFMAIERRQWEIRATFVEVHVCSSQVKSGDRKVVLNMNAFIKVNTAMVLRPSHDLVKVPARVCGIHSRHTFALSRVPLPYQNTAEANHVRWVSLHFGRKLYPLTWYPQNKASFAECPRCNGSGDRLDRRAKCQQCSRLLGPCSSRNKASCV